MTARVGVHAHYDPTGDMRAELLARLEYDLNPVTDERYDAVYGAAARRAVEAAEEDR